MKKITLLFIFLGCLSACFADTLVGMVTDGTAPMSYVSVYLKNKPEIGTVSDLDGVFTLPDIEKNTTVVLSFVGYKTMELKFKKIPADTLQITMEEQPILLTEVLVPSKTKKLSTPKSRSPSRGTPRFSGSPSSEPFLPS